MSVPDAIVASGVHAGYGRRDVLRGLDLRVPEGCVTAVLGRNGEGKTTLFRLLLGLVPARRGTVRVAGLDPARTATRVKARTGWVPDASDLDPRWRVRDVVDLVRGLRGRAWDAAEERRLLDAFALSRRTRVGELSKGGRAKLALLLALAPRPDLLLLDEPASGLDPIVRREVLATLVDAIPLEGRTVLIASHRMDDVARLADRLVFLSGGRVVREGWTDELRTARSLEQVFVDVLAPDSSRGEAACGA